MLEADSFRLLCALESALEPGVHGLEDVPGRCGQLVPLGHCLKSLHGPLEVLERRRYVLDVLLGEEYEYARHEHDRVERPEEQSESAMGISG